MKFPTITPSKISITVTDIPARIEIKLASNINIPKIKGNISAIINGPPFFLIIFIKLKKFREALFIMLQSPILDTQEEET